MPERPKQQDRGDIESALAAAVAWLVSDQKHVDIIAAGGVAIREFSLKPGHGFADYLLCVDGAAAGVVEARKEGVALTGVELQTLRYSEGRPEDLAAPRHPLPFCYQLTALGMPPDVLAAEIVEDLHAAQDEFALIAADLRVK